MLFCHGGREDVAAIIAEEPTSFGFIVVHCCLGLVTGLCLQCLGLGGRGCVGGAQTASGSHQESWLSSHRAMSMWV